MALWVAGQHDGAKTVAEQRSCRQQFARGGERRAFETAVVLIVPCSTST